MRPSSVLDRDQASGPSITPGSSAAQTKDRLYTQLAGNFVRMNRALVQTSSLAEMLQMDLHAMRAFVGLDAATLMTVAASLNSDSGPEDTEKDKEVQRLTEMEDRSSTAQDQEES